MWGPDAPPIPPNVALRWFSIAVASFVSFGFLTKYALVADRPAIPREYPFSGLVTELGGLEENQVSPSVSDDLQTFDIHLHFTFSLHRLGRKASMTRIEQRGCVPLTWLPCQVRNKAPSFLEMVQFFDLDYLPIHGSFCRRAPRTGPN
jgi:hypothetical protein